MLTAEWRRTRPFDLTVIGPSILGPDAPSGADLVRLGEFGYARFCHRFRQASTARILSEDPRGSVVLVNDISEAPDFARIGAAGFPIATIYHVDVAAYVSTMYFRGLIAPETAVRWFERLERIWTPAIMRLVWANQRASLRYSSQVFVPSEGMRDLLERCYPREPLEKVRVVPWGVPAAVSAPAEEVARVRSEFAIQPDAITLLTLSRLSPEKSQDTLLEALAEWESTPGFPSHPVILLVCGGAAYMQGRRHLDTLHRLAGRLKKVRVHFPGHVTGMRKAALLGAADIYVFPSRHESYGLTLLEVLQAGLPAVCVEHDGSSQIMRPQFGITVKQGSRTALWRAIADLARDRERRLRMSESARRFADTQRFEDTAMRLAAMLTQLGTDTPAA
jgi:glycosyltransferase involved in cell wall biosynthesis